VLPHGVDAKDSSLYVVTM